MTFFFPNLQTSISRADNRWIDVQEMDFCKQSFSDFDAAKRKIIKYSLFIIEFYFRLY